ncbi:MAG TPA: DNA polymerase IV, partial [Polyangiaceae bacterium]
MTTAPSSNSDTLNETPARVILHADMDAFFASVEARDHPELDGKPVIVGGLSPRGVVSAASYAARQFGIRSAMPMFEARRRCPHGVFIAPNMEHYAAISAQVRDIFMEFTPEIEPIALDEAFLDITHSLTLFGDPVELAERLKRRVHALTRLTISVGIASSKLIAKIACTSGKPDGFVFVPFGAEKSLLEPMSVRRLWGIGPVSAAALERRGIMTIGQLARCWPPELANVLGSRASDLVDMANGRDPRPVQPDRDPKSYGEESTFEQDLLDRSHIEATITAHSEAVARRLRHDAREGRTVTLKIKSSHAVGRKPDRNQLLAGAPEYPQITRSRTLSLYTSDGGEI